MQAIEVFFDHTCPYCYRGLAAFAELLPQYPGLAVTWRPVEAHPVEEEPEHLPHAHLAVQGALCVCAAGGDEAAYNDNVFKAVFEKRLPPDDIGVLKQCAAQAGADEAAFTQALTDEELTQARLRANDYAYEQNAVWAVPTFVCGELRLDAALGVGVTKEQIGDFLSRCASGQLI
jgi:predicted DsbA family dithiol-disulfide isomerase